MVSATGGAQALSANPKPINTCLIPNTCRDS